MGKKIDDAGVTNSPPALLTDYVPIGRDGTARNLTLAQLFCPIGYENTVTAFAGGGQGSATALSTGKYHRISVCATAADSVSIAAATANDFHVVRNDGAASAQIFSASTINAIAGSTGIPLPAGATAFFTCTVAGAWTASVVQNYLVIALTSGATFTGAVTVPSLTVSGAAAIVQQSVSGANTFAGSAAFSSAVTVSGAFNASGAINGVSATLSSRLNANSVQASAIVHTANVASALTMVGAHAGMQIDHSHSAGVALTIPPNTGQFLTGCVVIHTQQSAGQVTFTPGTGVTIANVNSQTKSQAVNSVTFVQLTDVADRWNLVGATGA